jgi:hypothetical protein
VAGPAIAVESALASLARAGRDQRLSTHVSWLAATDQAGGQLWITGEIDAESARSSDWAGGGNADVIVTSGTTGETIASVRQPVAAAARVVSAAVPDVKLVPGDYTVQVRLGPRSGGGALMDSVTFTVPDGGSRLGPPRLQRRGPATGTEFLLTANPTFRRNERLRVLVPVASPPAAVSAELLDRKGSTMAVSVDASLRRDENEPLTWATAELALAPLAPGDYVIRTTVERDNHRQEVLAAFRMVP